MKLGKAIEIVEKHGVVDETTTWGDYLAAAKILAEAGKAELEARAGLNPCEYDLLPGETEEETQPLNKETIQEFKNLIGGRK